MVWPHTPNHQSRQLASRKKITTAEHSVTNSKHYKQIYLVPECLSYINFQHCLQKSHQNFKVAIPEFTSYISLFFVQRKKKTLAKLNISKWPQTRTITHGLPCWCCWCGRSHWSVSGTTPGISGRPGICHGFYMAGRQRFFLGKLEPKIKMSRRQKWWKLLR